RLRDVHEQRGSLRQSRAETLTQTVRSLEFSLPPFTSEIQMVDAPRPLAVVTGASSGIGFELAKQCAEHGFDLVIVADEPAINQAADDLGSLGTSVDPLQLDLSTVDGVNELISQLRCMDRPIDALLANAGIGLGHGFLEQDMADVMKVLDT